MATFELNEIVFAKNCRMRRAELGLSTVEAARRAGISPETYLRYERGNTPKNEKKARAVMEALKLTDLSFLTSPLYVPREQHEALQAVSGLSEIQAGVRDILQSLQRWNAQYFPVGEISPDETTQYFIRRIDEMEKKILANLNKK